MSFSKLNYFILKDRLSGFLNGILLKHFFLKCGTNLRVIKPLKIINLKRIIIGDDVRINYKAWIQVDNNQNGKIIIGSNSIIGHFNHIYAYKEIIIGANVLTADKVYISDCTHNYENINLPISLQEVKYKSSVHIGDNSWIGENVVILGAKIGKHCVIGANSVVTKDIPDYSVVAGIPARILKKYCFIECKWITIP